MLNFGMQNFILHYLNDVNHLKTSFKNVASIFPGHCYLMFQDMGGMQPANAIIIVALLAIAIMIVSYKRMDWNFADFRIECIEHKLEKIKRAFGGVLVVVDDYKEKEIPNEYRTTDTEEVILLLNTEPVYVSLENHPSLESAENVYEIHEEQIDEDSVGTRESLVSVEDLDEIYEDELVDKMSEPLFEAIFMQNPTNVEKDQVKPDIAEQLLAMGPNIEIMELITLIKQKQDNSMFEKAFIRYKPSKIPVWVATRIKRKPINQFPRSAHTITFF